MNPGKTLQDFRKLHGLKQRDIAAFMFVHPTTVSLWERNKTQVSVETFEKIMDHLGYEVCIRKKKEKSNE